MEEKFNEDYFEKGVEKKISGYTNYRYIPTRSFEEASSIKTLWMRPGTLLDWGCAKGFLVHSLRRLGFQAFGYDISEYAIKNGKAEVLPYISNKKPRMSFNYLVCKDVMEHVHEEEVPITLKEMRSVCEGQALFVIPLGDNDKLRIREYEMDVTHITKKDEDWWLEQFTKAGFNILWFGYKVGDLKKKWVAEHPHGNGFFLLGGGVVRENNNSLAL